MTGSKKTNPQMLRPHRSVWMPQTHLKSLSVFHTAQSDAADSNAAESRRNDQTSSCLNIVFVILGVLHDACMYLGLSYLQCEDGACTPIRCISLMFLIVVRQKWRLRQVYHVPVTVYDLISVFLAQHSRSSTYISVQ